MKSTSIIVVSAVLLELCLGYDEEKDCQKKSEGPEVKIVGGADAKPGEATWYVR